MLFQSNTSREDTVMDYLKKSKCKCGHLYDYYNEGRPTEKYFYQPTKQGPFFLDKAKIYQMDPMEDFIRNTVRESLLSQEPTVILRSLLRHIFKLYMEHNVSKT